MSDQIGKYADINGLKMYYEIHGTGEPLLMLHGGLTTIEMFSNILPVLVQKRQIIAVEQQGHGHTADIDRPFSFKQMADDTAALLEYLGYVQVDVFGYSSGGSVALELAVRHPEGVRRLALASTIYNIQGYFPPIAEGLKHASAADLPDEMREAYERVAPNPRGWAALVEKAGKSAAEPGSGLTAKQVKSIHVPALVIVADGDIIRPEHSAELARMLRTEVVVLPDSDHASYIVGNAQALLSRLTAFLDTPVN